MHKKNTAKKAAWTVVPILLIMVFVTTAAALPSYNPQILEREVSLSMNDVTLNMAIKQIETTAHVKFVYSSNQFDLDERITIVAERKKLYEILRDLFEPRGIQYTVDTNKEHILLIRRKPSKETSHLESVNAIAESIYATVSGKVIDATTQQPMAGVSVLVKGFNRGTTTDADGGYNIEADINDVLVFSFIGYKTIEERIEARTVIDILMEEDITSLKEVEINAGYWKVKEREQTGSIARVSESDIQKQPIANPLAALHGRMPGVYIRQFSGLPGSGFNITIRGQNSLRNDGNDPLYLIDGVPFTSTSLHSTAMASANSAANPLNSINPSDIESIEILKDADATAIYGTRGANGVVLITTKRGKAGRTTVDISLNQGVGKVSRTMDLLNTQQYMAMRREAFHNDNATPKASDYDLTQWDTTRYTDWQKTLIGGTAKVTNLQASVSGGNENTQVAFRLSNYRETTVFPGDFSYDRNGGYINVNHVSDNKKFELALTVNYVRDLNRLPQTDLTARAISLPPVAPALYDEKGNINWENGTFLNPLGKYLLETYEAHTKNLVSNLSLRYNFSNNFFLKTSAGFTDYRMDEYTETPIRANSPSSNVTTGESRFANAFLTTWIVEPQLGFEKVMGNGQLTTLMGVTFQDNLREANALRATGFTNDAMLANMVAASAITVQQATQSHYRYNAVFGRVNYSLKQKYIINLTGRRDGSSRFGEGRRFANVGAIGTAWIFSNEGFFSALSRVMNFGKIRASYGVTGSDQIPDYGYMDTYSAIGFYQAQPALIPTRLVNPDFSWESNKKLEVATELGFLKDRIFITAAWYRNRASRQLVGLPLASTTGFASVQYNLPAVVRNTGLEMTVTSLPVVKQNLKWSSSVNITIPRNKLVQYDNLDSSPNANRYTVGKSVYTEKRYHVIGVDPETGWIMFEDVDANGNDMDYPGDLQPLKEVAQKYFGGWQHTINYKNVQLDIFFQFVKQTGQHFIQYFNAPGTMSNQPVSVMERWQQSGDRTNVQRFTQTGTAFTRYTMARSLGDNAITDASFITLKNVAFTWQLPQAWLEKWKIRKCSFSLQAQNVIILTKFEGMNPENQNVTALPPLRMFTTGLNIAF